MIAVLIFLIIIFILYQYYEPTIDLTLMDEHDEYSKIRVTLYYTAHSTDVWGNQCFERHSKLLFII
jgi:hypothetical protein